MNYPFVLPCVHASDNVVASHQLSCSLTAAEAELVVSFAGSLSASLYLNCDGPLEDDNLNTIVQILKPHQNTIEEARLYVYQRATRIDQLINILYFKISYGILQNNRVHLLPRLGRATEYVSKIELIKAGRAKIFSRFQSCTASSEDFYKPKGRKRVGVS